MKTIVILWACVLVTMFLAFGATNSGTSANWQAIDSSSALLSGNASITGNITNSALSANTMVYSAGGSVLASIGSVTSGTNVTVGGMQASVFKASDGTSGITTNIVAGLVTFTIKNGLIVGVSL